MSFSRHVLYKTKSLTSKGSQFIGEKDKQMAPKMQYDMHWDIWMQRIHTVRRWLPGGDDSRAEFLKVSARGSWLSETVG